MPASGRRRPPPPGALADLPPLRIFLQIVSVQSSYYLSLGMLLLFTSLVSGRPFHLGLLFSWASLRGDTATGWMLGVVWLLNALIGAIFILVLVARSKLVPDFVLTLHGIHLVLTTLYSGSVPTFSLWWGLMAGSVAVMWGAGGWSCRWRELQPMSFGAAVAARVGTVEEADVGGGDEEGGQEERWWGGFGRRRGRTRGEHLQQMVPLDGHRRGQPAEEEAGKGPARLD